jgi:hypothetical protein
MNKKNKNKLIIKTLFNSQTQIRFKIYKILKNYNQKNKIKIMKLELITLI